MQPGITKTNRQIRQECLPIFYLENIFEYHLPGCNFGYFIDYMNTIRVRNRKNILEVTLVIKDRLSCGKGLHDFVQWCVQAVETENMFIDVTVDDWHAEYLDEKASHEHIELEKQDPYSCEYLKYTVDALVVAILVAKDSCNKGRTKDLQVRKAWERELHETRFQCGSCDRGHFSRGELDKDMEEGHCSDMSRHVDFGTACNETETETSSEGAQAHNNQVD